MSYVALATCLDIPEPDVDETLLLKALEDVGVPVRVLAWDDPSVDWSAPSLTVIRSTWNYYRKLDAFLAWVLERGGRLQNPVEIVRWNHHKRYLADLAAKGIPVVPTLWVERGGSALDALAAVGWRDAVVKPAVSAGSYRTRRVSGPPFDEAVLAESTAAGDTMVQPYVASVEGYGERSIVCVDGAVSHAVRKDARFQGDGERVSAQAAPIAEDERALATRVLSCIESELLYARVDIVRDDAGRPMVGELELIEPSLFLTQHPPAAQRLAQAIARRHQAR